MKRNESFVTIQTAPTVEPVTLVEAKEHIRLNSGSFSNYISSEQSIEPADYAPGTTNGTGIDVLNTQSLVMLVCGVAQATATLDAKIQESDDNIAFSDWAGGSFAQVTDANDQTTYEKAYTGTKRYIRVVGVVADANVEYSANVTTGTAITVEDDLITSWIIKARQLVELESNKTLITQTWKLTMDRFPLCGIIELPKNPVQSITSIKYYDTDNTLNTFGATKYTLDANNTTSAILLNDGQVWADGDTLRDYRAVEIIFITGYGDAASDVPDYYKQAINMLVGHFYENREHTTEINIRNLPFNMFDVLGYDRDVPI